VEYRAYRYRIYPNKTQCEYFAKVFGCVRFVYNKMIEDSENYYKLEGKRLQTNPHSYKSQFPFLREVDSSALSNAKMNLDYAYDRFFKKATDRPRFKSKKDNRCTFTTSMYRNNIRIEGEYIRLPKIKFIRAKIHRKFEGTIKKATVIKEPSGEYFITLLVEAEVEKLPVNERAIGLDMGVINLLTCSDGSVVENVRSYDRYMKKLARENRWLSRKKKGGRNREKQRIRLANIHRKITSIRDDFLHKVSRKIVNENQVIACENLIIGDLLKTNYFSRRDIMDASWVKLTNYLEYKSRWYGRQFVRVDTFYPSSQICSDCGFRNHDLKGHNIKEWECPSCGTIHQRDYNAAKNILHEGLRILSSDEVGRCEYPDTEDHIFSTGTIMVDVIG